MKQFVLILLSGVFKPNRRQFLGSKLGIATCLFPFVYLTLILFSNNGLNFREFNDTLAYQNLASRSLFDDQFYTGAKPITVPLFFKIAGIDSRNIVFMQMIIAAAAWGLLAYAAAAVSRHQLIKWGSLAGTLTIGSAANVTVWNGTILSESLNVSLLIATFSTGLLFLRNQNRLNMTLFLVVAVFWGLARETNSWALMAMVFAAGIAMVLYRDNDRTKLTKLGIVFSVFLILFAFSALTTRHSGRWVSPLGHIVQDRILPNESRLEYFQDRGMPVNDAVRSISATASAEAKAVKYLKSDFDEYREWSVEKGSSTYISFMLSHPRYTFTEPLSRYRYLLFWNLESYAPENTRSLLPAFAHYKLFESLRAFLAVAILGAVAILAARKYVDRTLAIYGSGLVLLSVILSMGVYLADAMEWPRHSLNSMVMLRVGLLLFMIAALDGVMRIVELKKNRRSNSDHAGHSPLR